LFLEMGVGGWGLGFGDWGLGIGPNPQSPIPNPQSPIPIYIIYNSIYIYILIIFNIFNKLYMNELNINSYYVKGDLFNY